jgi:dipeptidyl-peptidase 4
VDYPELAARTRRFTNGSPLSVSVAGDGGRVVFVRSAGAEDPAGCLWMLDAATGEERLVAEPVQLTGDRNEGITSYALDRNGRIAAFTIAGRLFRADLINGDVVEVATAGPAVDPRPDPAGERIAYLTAHPGLTDRGEPVATTALHIVDPDGTDMMLAGERDSNGTVAWGAIDYLAGEAFDRGRGYWWAPDGRSVLAARVDTSRLPRLYLHDPVDPGEPAPSLAYPRAGGPNPQVSLHLLDLDGQWVDVHWDRETYPYLVSVRWADGGPLIAVLRRLQQHGLVLSVDPRTGETQVHAELTDPRWVEPIDGTPCHLPDGRVLVGGELAHDGYDARCLFADGSLLTPPSLYVRRVVGPVTGGADLLVEGTDGEPSEQHLYRIRGALGAGGMEAKRITTEPGWHVAATGGGLLAIGRLSLDHAGTRWSVWRGDTRVGGLASHASPPPFAPRPALERVTDRRLPAAVLYPRHHVSGRRLPVLLDVYGGPGRQEVLAARSWWLERQWWADAGFAVVTIDNRGTPGVAPSFEKVVHRRLADIALTDQTDALAALGEKHPDLDTHRVAVRGWALGGWLAALAVLRRPDVFACGVARTPLTDWSLHNTAFAERYLGLPDDEIYPHHNLVEIAAEPPVRPEDARPLLLVHGMADDSIIAAHTLRLSAAMVAAGRPHAVLPLSGVARLAGHDVAEQLLPLELDFVRRHLPPG